MRKKLPTGLSLGLILFMTSTLLVAAAAPRKGSIRGGVYIDIDGNGSCSATDTAVSRVDILFANQEQQAVTTLYSGNNGTYGLVSVVQGTWYVSIDSAEWVVTSPNPLTVSVSEDDKLVQTNINFCVQQGSGSSATTSTAPTNNDGASSDLALNHQVSESLLSSSAITTTALLQQDNPNITAPAALVAEDWLSYLNQFREIAGLHPFVEDAALSSGAQSHARYMVVNDKPIAHSEDRSNFLYSDEGQQAAENGNIFATSQVQADYEWGINFWISAPFHLLGIIDPELETVGYGQNNQATGTFRMAAVLDVGTERENSNVDVEYPIFFPGDGQETMVVRRSLYEWPDPLAPCPGYSAPTGAAIVLQIGDGSLTPNVTGALLLRDGTPVASCVYDETSYVNSDIYAQNAGRSILDIRDAIVIIPKRPLRGGVTYTARITANGETYSWNFTARKP